MKIQLASDLHHEMAKGSLAQPIRIAPDADVLVLAGDIHSATGAVRLYGTSDVPVVYVHGNHELGDRPYRECLSGLRVAARDTAVKFLERDEFWLDGVRFLGACLWTDFALDATRQMDAMETAREAMFEYRHRHDSGGREALFEPEDACTIYRETVDWLDSRLRTSRQTTVVVTHHAPSLLSIPPPRRQHPLAAAYASRLDELVSYADLWIHGHVHRTADYYVGGCRVLCNPRGRRGRNRLRAEIGYENADFNPELTVELAVPDGRQDDDADFQ